MQRLLLSLGSFLLFFTSWAHANLTVDRMFSDHMVLQRDMAVPVWGTADPGAEVTVAIGEITQSTTAAPGGKWMLKVGPLTVGEPQTLKVTSGGKEIAFSDVLIGEVWLGSGQSNMAGKAASYAKNDPVLAENLQGGPYPGLRLYSPKGWAIADEAKGNAFSAILFSFGLKLQQELDVPVGLMMGAVGGTPSVRWMTGDMMEANAPLMAAMKEATGYTSVDDLRAAHDEAHAQWQKEADALKAEGKEVPKFTGPTNPGDLYSRYIAPFAPYGIRGVLWDQGEAKTRLEGVDQFTAMTALITGWREVWGQGEFPFLHVQKPSGGVAPFDPENPINGGAASFAPEYPAKRSPSLVYNLDHIKMNTIKNAPLVTALDLGTGIHPANKSGYGARAVRVALGEVYGREIATCGPLYRSHTVDGDKVRVQFEETGEGLTFRHADELRGFEVSGSDGVWHWAEAKIESPDTVMVNSPQVAAPVNVRYAFERVPNYANLYNLDGLPGLMFTTEK